MRNAWIAVVLLVAVAAAAVAEDKLVLLTGNGVANEKHSEYKDAPTVELKGAGYYATPPMYGEKGTAEKLIPLREGILTNGDSSSAWRRKPSPYTYWQSKQQGELVFEFGRQCRIKKIRIRSLFTKSSGCSHIAVYDRGKEGEDKEKLLLGKVEEPKGAWNEIKDLDKVADGLRIEFKGVKGKTYIHVTEIEIWGVLEGKK